MEIIQTNNRTFGNDIKALYTEAFSTGISRQYIDPVELNNYIDGFFDGGGILLAIENEKTVGALLYHDLEKEGFIPAEISIHYVVGKCAYIAEVMVSEADRGQGTGKKLLDKFFETVDTGKYTDAFIRVWQENKPALGLFLKTGFVPVAFMDQEKKKADGEGIFIMKKIYLHKKL